MNIHGHMDSFLDDTDTTKMDISELCDTHIDTYEN